MYELFMRYGTIRQIRIGNEQKSRGTAFVVFDDVMDVGWRSVFLHRSVGANTLLHTSRPRMHWTI